MTMGLLNKLRGELVDIIEWIDDSRQTLVWRFPRYHNQIKNGARLIVRPGQLAAFVHQGKLADVFEPGTYVLETANLPILSTLQGWLHGFDSPFKAEVYFIATRQVTELKWGTPNPVLVRDPDFGPIRVRAFGSYTLKARDPKALLNELVGTDSSFEADEIFVHLRSVIASCFGDLAANSGISIPDLSASYGELSDQLRQAVMARVSAEYGLDIPQLYIVNISLPAEVERALDARSSMNIVDDVAKYQHFQLAHSIPTAAANPAGGLAGAGVGMGMGLAIAREMGNPGWGGPSGPGGPGGGLGGPGGGGSMLGEPSPSASGIFSRPSDLGGGIGLGTTGGSTLTGTGGQTGPGTMAYGAPSTPFPPASPPWHLVEGGQAVGPFSEAEMGAGLGAGRIRPETLVWTPGMANWTPAIEVPKLAQLFRAGPGGPPPPPPSPHQPIR
jgi:membrane protease subunit (stomatin/prohibitin family)